MSRGRPRDSHRLRIVKDPRSNKDALDAVEDVIVKPLVGEPPAWLHELARDEWNRVALDLVKKDWLGAIDETLFARYCQAYARWREAEADIDERGNIIEFTDEEKGQHWEKENPSVKIAQKWASEMEKAAARFGITPGARKGWTQPKEQKSGIAQFRENLAT